MIRPVTAVCLLMAGASGLYLYQTKHRTFMLDRQIEQTIRDTAATRERSNMLRADWALLNDTTRLSDLAARHLMLHQTAPTQFVTMAELDHRLPPIRAFKPDDTAPVTPSGAPAVASPGAVPMARATPAAVPGQAPVQQAFAPAAADRHAGGRRAGAPCAHRGRRRRAGHRPGGARRHPGRAGSAVGTDRRRSRKAHRTAHRGDRGPARGRDGLA